MNTKNIQNLLSEKSKEREAGEELHVSEGESDPSFSRFLVISSKDATPIKYSIFAVQKFTQCGVGEVKEAKKLRNGTVLLEVRTKQQATQALAIDSLVRHRNYDYASPKLEYMLRRYPLSRSARLRRCRGIEWPRLTRRHRPQTHNAS